MSIDVITRELISSTAILISVVLLVNVAFFGKELGAESKRHEQAIIGVLFGLASIILNLFGIVEILFIEMIFVVLVIGISTYLGSNISGIITTLMYGLFFFSRVGISGELSFTIYLELLIVTGASLFIVYQGGTKQRIWYRMLKVNAILMMIGILVIGEYSFIVPFTTLYLLLGYLLYRLISYLDTVREVYKQYMMHAQHDFLTGLSNARMLDDKLPTLVQEAKQNHTALSTLMLDIDHFKKINDTYGHEAGDLVLQDLGNLLRKCCRINDLIIRKGGEEFCILLPHCDKETALKIAERIRQEVKFHSFIISSGRRINVTISIGVANLNDFIQKPNDLINFADEALYEAKKTGRNRVVAYH